jgi:serine/threonine protein kinase
MQAGDVIDNRFHVEKKLGQGGMGEVFRGKDSKLEKIVAIKVLFPNTPDQVIKRFHTEAKALAALNHPNVMTIFDFGQSQDGQLYLVMDFIKGDSLATMIEKRGAQTFPDVFPIFEKVCQGLRFAHMNNVLHRDIKPSNVMLAEDRTQKDSVKLVDFGLAKLADQDHHLTKTGSVMGSPPYMSPEAIHGKEVDERSDIYSLGCTFFEMMTGQPPFVGDTPFHTMMAHINRLAPTLSDVSGKEYDEEVEEFIRKCLKKNPDDRFKNMDELLAELNRIKTVLDEKRLSGLELLASGVYASGSRLRVKFINSDMKFKVIVAILTIGGAILLFPIFQQLCKPRSEIKQAKQPENRLSNLATEVGKPEVEEKIIQFNNREADYPKGATIIKQPATGLDVCLLSGEMTDSEVEEAIRPYREMKSFQLEKFKASDNALKSILETPGILALCLRHVELTDSLLEQVGNMKNLKFLQILNCNNVPQSIFGHLKRARLQTLDIDVGPEFKDLGKSMSQLKTLNGITIGLAKITRQDIDYLAQKTVGLLTLNTCEIEPDAFTDLKNAVGCGIFGCMNTKLTEEQLGQIAELPKVVFINLHRTNVRDEWLKQLYKCKKLIHLDVRKTEVTSSGVRALQRNIPTLTKVNAGAGLSPEEEMFKNIPGE